MDDLNNQTFIAAMDCYETQTARDTLTLSDKLHIAYIVLIFCHNTSNVTVNIHISCQRMDDIANCEVIQYNVVQIKLWTICR